MESKGTHEFLLGIEEYLLGLGCKEHATRIHSLASALSKPNSKYEVTRLFLQECSSILNPTDVHLADLAHKFSKIELTKNQDIELSIYLSHYKFLLQYLSNVVDNQKLTSLAHSLNKATDQESYQQDFVKTYISNLELDFPEDKFFRGINSCIKNKHLDQEIINDAFSRSQIKSKFWLIKELAKVQKHYVNVLVLAGWFGQTKSIYEKFLTYQKMRMVELDRHGCEISDYVFNLSNLENHKVKSIIADINNLTLHKNGYEWTVENFKESEKNYNEKFLPDLIINTSAEHMTEEWFHQIRFKQLKSNPIVAIQSNNMFDIDEHVNCVHSVDHMKKKFPMKEVLYEGELQLKGYKRVMLIGRP